MHKWTHHGKHVESHRQGESLPSKRKTTFHLQNNPNKISTDFSAEQCVPEAVG